MIDHLLLIFNLNLGVDLRVQLILKYKVKFDNFDLIGIIWFLTFYICEFQDLDIIWLVN